MRATPNSETVKNGNFRAFISLILKIFSVNFQVKQEKKNNTSKPGLQKLSKNLQDRPRNRQP